MQLEWIEAVRYQEDNVECDGETSIDPLGHHVLRQGCLCNHSREDGATTGRTNEGRVFRISAERVLAINPADKEEDGRMFLAVFD